MVWTSHGVTLTVARWLTECCRLAAAGVCCWRCARAMRTWHRSGAYWARGCRSSACLVMRMYLPVHDACDLRDHGGAAGPVFGVFVPCMCASDGSLRLEVLPFSCV